MKKDEAYYRDQYYDPDDPRADRLGYVHGKKDFIDRSDDVGQWLVLAWVVVLTIFLIIVINSQGV